jgi:hypothetical protein
VETVGKAAGGFSKGEGGNPKKLPEWFPGAGEIAKKDWRVIHTAQAGCAGLIFKTHERTRNLG